MTLQKISFGLVHVSLLVANQIPTLMVVADNHIHQWKCISLLKVLSFFFFSSHIVTASDFCVFVKEICTTQVLNFALERKSVESFKASFTLHGPQQCQKKLYVRIRNDFESACKNEKKMFLSTIPTSSATLMLGYSKSKLYKNSRQRWNKC